MSNGLRMNLNSGTALWRIFSENRTVDNFYEIRIIIYNFHALSENQNRNFEKIIIKKL